MQNMFQSIRVEDIFDNHMTQASEHQPSYWLAQLRQSDWLVLLEFVNVNVSHFHVKRALAEIALQRFDFRACQSREDVWQTWGETHNLYRGLVIQFRHSDSNWSRSMPEFVDL